MDNTHRKCVVCGKLYKACRNCKKEIDSGTIFWRASCDTRECFSVMLILSDFYYNRISKSEARSLLDEYLNTDMLPYSENTKNLIDKIYDRI